MSAFLTLSVFPIRLSERFGPILVKSLFDYSEKEGQYPLLGIGVLYLGLFLIFAVPVAILVTRKFLRYSRARREKTFIEEMLLKARKSEEAGEFVSAAFIYEKLKQPEKAAALYETGGDFVRAAALYEDMGELAKAKEMSEKAGDPLKAAATCMSMGDYLGAARIYDGIGDKKAAGRAFETAGNRLAAVRAYREAKDYLRASALLKEEGMPGEAADMYKLSLTEKMTKANLDSYYSYAALLEASGRTGDAWVVYHEISELDRDFMDAAAKVESLRPAEPEKASVLPVEEIPAVAVRNTPSMRRGTSLRSIMQSGKMEPRYCMRLWVQILKSLSRSNERNILHLAPESILIDTENNVTFDAAAARNPLYAAPEEAEGAPTDRTSVVFSAGLILHEMLTGGLENPGGKPSEAAPEVPAWLDELTVKCLAADRSLRYRDIDDIFSSLKTLKNKE